MHRKAQRLRAVTGNKNLVTQYELDHPPTSFVQAAKTTLWRPIILSISEPRVKNQLVPRFCMLIMFLCSLHFPVSGEFVLSLVELGTFTFGLTKCSSEHHLHSYHLPCLHQDIYSGRRKQQ